MCFHYYCKTFLFKKKNYTFSTSVIACYEVPIWTSLSRDMIKIPGSGLHWCTTVRQFDFQAIFYLVISRIRIYDIHISFRSLNYLSNAIRITSFYILMMRYGQNTSMLPIEHNTLHVEELLLLLFFFFLWLFWVPRSCRVTFNMLIFTFLTFHNSRNMPFCQDDFKIHIIELQSICFYNQCIQITYMTQKNQINTYILNFKLTQNHIKHIKLMSNNIHIKLIRIYTHHKTISHKLTDSKFILN